MVSNFGLVMREIRSKAGDSLRTCAAKLDISAPFLSAMEVGRRPIPSHYLEKIKSIYDLSEEEYTVLYNSVVETNKRVDIGIDRMTDAQKEVSVTFARKIENADSELVEKLRKVLMESNDSD